MSEIKGFRIRGPEPADCLRFFGIQSGKGYAGGILFPEIPDCHGNRTIFRSKACAASGTVSMQAVDKAEMFSGLLLFDGEMVDTVLTKPVLCPYRHILKHLIRLFLILSGKQHLFPGKLSDIKLLRDSRTPCLKRHQHLMKYPVISGKLHMSVIIFPCHRCLKGNTQSL